ncbi:MAG: hypothetical protein QXK95_00800 [Nitrososphaerota archaeon]|nr:hypothetical protein [Candidatus Geocrenenecus dongiae]
MSSKSRRNIVKCPNCGHVFEVSYSRVFSCGGCPSVISCKYVKCPECGYEFQK